MLPLAYHLEYVDGFKVLANSFLYLFVLNNPALIESFRDSTSVSFFFGWHPVNCFILMKADPQLMVNLSWAASCTAVFYF